MWMTGSKLWLLKSCSHCQYISITSWEERAPCTGCVITFTSKLLLHVNIHYQYFKCRSNYIFYFLYPFSGHADNLKMELTDAGVRWGSHAILRLGVFRVRHGGYYPLDPWTQNCMYGSLVGEDCRGPCLGMLPPSKLVYGRAVMTGILCLLLIKSRSIFQCMALPLQLKQILLSLNPAYPQRPLDHLATICTLLHWLGWLIKIRYFCWNWKSGLWGRWRFTGFQEREDFFPMWEVYLSNQI